MAETKTTKTIHIYMTDKEYEDLAMVAKHYDNQVGMGRIARNMIRERYQQMVNEGKFDQK